MQPRISNAYKNLSKLGNITTPYGGRTRTEPFHPGVDIANKKGTNIPAFTGGKVVDVVTGKVNGDKDFGNKVSIQDPTGAIHQYGHLAQPLVTEGQQVQPNQIIGKMGDTGNSYSPKGGDSSHLDYRVEGRGGYVNPLPYTQNANIPPTNTVTGAGGYGGKTNISVSRKFALAHRKHKRA